MKFTITFLATILNVSLLVSAEPIRLTAADATIINATEKGAPQLKAEALRGWKSIKAYPVWKLKISEPVKVAMIVRGSNYNEEGAVIEAMIGDFVNSAKVTDTGSWTKMKNYPMGQLTLPAGTHELSLKALSKPNRVVIDFQTIFLHIKSGNGSIEIIPPENPAEAKSGSPYDSKPGFQNNLNALHPALIGKTLSFDGIPLKVGGMAFSPDGTLYVSVWDYTGAVYAITNYSSEKPDIRKVADGLAEPLGLCFIGDRLFVGQKQELTELVDHDNDGIFDEYKCISNRWPVSSNFHQFTFGPVQHNGKLYLNLAVAIDPGGATTVPQSGDRGCCIEVDPETGDYKIIAAGLRTPNGITITSAGDILVNDNQGDYLPSSKMVHVRQDKFFNHEYQPRHAWADRPVSPPVVWQPQNEIGNSPTEPIELPESWGPYAGQILHGDIRHAGLKRVFMEKINGEWQGALFRFSQGLLGGTNRLAFGPDEKLYVGIAGNSGNWGRDGFTGLQTLEFSTANVPFEMKAVRAKSDGVEIEFTEPLAEGQGWDPAYYRIDTWGYQPTEKYGGPKIGHQRTLIKAVSISEDRTRASLQLSNMIPGNVIHIVLHQDLTSASGKTVYSGECWYTLNHIPAGQGLTLRSAPVDYTKLAKVEEVQLSKGEQIHKTYCFVCHSTDGTRLVGPSFEGMFGRKQKIWRNGVAEEITVDREYIKAGIINPPAEYPDTYQPVMPPTLHEAIPKQDLEKLIDWIVEL